MQINPKDAISRDVSLAHVPGSDLTLLQKKTAATLRAMRPMCVPGTNAIILASEAEAWHGLVTKAAIELNLNPQQVATFCDAAGVAT